MCQPIEAFDAWLADSFDIRSQLFRIPHLILSGISVLLLQEAVSGTECQILNSFKSALTCFTVFCSFSEASSHPGVEGTGTEKPCFQRGVVQVFRSLPVWGLVLCCRMSF